MTFMLALDLETTGLVHHNPSIIEICAKFYNGRQHIATFHEHVRADRSKSVSLSALRVVRKSTDEIYSYEVSQHDVAEKFVNFLIDHVFPVSKNAKIKILGQNVHFDITLLKKLLEENLFLGWDDIFANNPIDTCTIGNALREGGIIDLETMCLEKLALALEISIDANLLHTAKYDTELSVACYFKMLDILHRLKRCGEKSQNL